MEWGGQSRTRPAPPRKAVVRKGLIWLGRWSWHGQVQGAKGRDRLQWAKMGKEELQPSQKRGHLNEPGEYCAPPFHREEH